MEWRHPLVRGLHRGRGADGDSAQPGLQRPDPGRRVLRPAHHRRRPAHEHGARVPAPGHEARQSARAHRGARHQHRARGQARGRRALHAGWTARRAERGARAARGYPVGRRLQLAAAPARCRASGRRRCCPRSAFRCCTIWRASARTCGDHYAPRFVARVKNIITINELARGVRLAGEVAKYLINRRGILSLNPTLVYVLLALRARHRQQRPAAHVHAGQLQGRRAVAARRFPGRDGRLLAAAAREQGLCARALVRSVRCAHHPAQLSRRGGRPARARSPA